MSAAPSVEQVQQLAWATRDDLFAALDDLEQTGSVYAKLVDVDGDLRLKRVSALQAGVRRA